MEKVGPKYQRFAGLEVSFVEKSRHREDDSQLSLFMQKKHVIVNDAALSEKERSHKASRKPRQDRTWVGFLNSQTRVVQKAMEKFVVEYYTPTMGLF